MWIFKVVLVLASIQHTQSKGGFSSFIGCAVHKADKIVHSASKAVTGGYKATCSLLKDAGESVSHTINALESISEVVVNDIKKAPEIFEQEIWDKLADGAKFVITKLESSNIIQYIKTAVNYFLSFIKEWLPKPLDRIEKKDFITLGQCIHVNVLNAAVDWSKNIATSYLYIYINIYYNTLFIL